MHTYKQQQTRAKRTLRAAMAIMILVKSLTLLFFIVSTITMAS